MTIIKNKQVLVTDCSTPFFDKIGALGKQKNAKWMVKFGHVNVLLEARQFKIVGEQTSTNRKKKKGVFIGSTKIISWLPIPTLIKEPMECEKC